MADIKAKSRQYSPEDLHDIIGEVKRLLDESGVKYTLEADLPTPKDSCTKCVNVPCFICV